MYPMCNYKGVKSIFCEQITAVYNIYLKLFFFLNISPATINLNFVYMSKVGNLLTKNALYTFVTACRVHFEQFWQH